MMGNWVAELIWVLAIPIVAHVLAYIIHKILGKFTKEIVIHEFSGKTRKLRVPANAGTREIWEKVDEFYANELYANQKKPADLPGSQDARNGHRKPRVT